MERKIKIMFGFTGKNIKKSNNLKNSVLLKTAAFNNTEKISDSDENSVSSLPKMSEKEKKAASRELKKFQKNASALLKRRNAQNHSYSFFVKNLLGKWILRFRKNRLLKQADAAFQKHDLSSAKIILERIISWEPDSPAIWLALAKIAYEEKQFDQAIRETTAICSFPKEQITVHLLAETLCLRASALLLRNKFHAALADWHTLLSNFPNNPHILHQTGLLYLKLNQISNAVVFLKAAAAGRSDNFEILTALGHALFLADSFDEAYETNLKSLRILHSLAEEHCPEFQGNEAIQKYLENLTGPDGEILYQCCLNFLCQTAFLLTDRDQEQARGFCRLILDLDPENHKGLILAGTLEYQMEHWDEALKIHQKINSILPELEHIQWNLGDILFHLEKFEEAVPCFKKSIERNHREHEAVSAILTCLKKLNKIDEMEQFCSEMIQKGKKWPEIYHTRSGIRYHAGNILAAFEDLKMALTLDPEYSSAWHDLAIIQFTVKDFSGTLQTCRHFLQKEPNAKDIRILSFLAMKELGKIQETNEALNEFLAEFPDDFDAIFLKAQISRETGNFKNAKEYFQKALEIKPSHPQAMLGKIDSAAELGNMDEAIHGISQMILTDQKNSRLILQRALYLSMSRRFDEALKDCDAILNEKPDFTDAWITKGEIRKAMGLPEAAILDFQQAEALDPENSWALLKMAELKISMELFQPALNDLEKILAIDPQNENAAISKIHTLVRLDKIEKALEYSAEILEMNEQNLKVRFHRAGLLFHLQRTEEALNDLDFVVKNDPDSIEPHYLRAIILNALFRHEEAIAELDIVLMKQPDFLPALSEKAVACLHLKKKKSALLIMNRILAIEPDNVKILNMRGSLLTQKRKNKKALNDFTRSVEVKPDFAPGFNNLGHLLIIMGDQEKAMDALNTAIALAPNWSRPYLNRAVLHLQRNELEECENDIQTAITNARNSGDEEVIVEAASLRPNIKIFKSLLENFDEDENKIIGEKNEYEEDEDDSIDFAIESEADDDEQTRDFPFDEWNQHEFSENESESDGFNSFVSFLNKKENQEEEEDENDDSWINDFSDEDGDELDDEIQSMGNIQFNANFDDDEFDEDFDDEFEDEDFDDDEFQEYDFDKEALNEDLFEISNSPDNQTGNLQKKEIEVPGENPLDIDSKLKQSIHEDFFIDIEGSINAPANSEINEIHELVWDKNNLFPPDSEIPLMTDREPDSEMKTIYWQYFDFDYFKNEAKNAPVTSEELEQVNALFASILENLSPGESNDSNQQNPAEKEKEYEDANTNSRIRVNKNDARDDENLLPKRFDFMLTPFIIHCPQFIIWKNAMMEDSAIRFDEISMDDQNFSRNTFFVRYGDSPEKFFEALTMISEILDFQTRKAEEGLPFRKYRKQKRKLTMLMEEISENLMQEHEADMLLVFTNLLRPEILKHFRTEEE